MADTNTDFVVESIVDIIINSMKPQFEGKVPAVAFDTVRSGAVLAVNSAIPFPLRMVINTVPKKHLDALVTKTQTAIGTVTVTNTDLAVEPIVDSIVNSMKSLFGGKVPVAAFDTVRSGIVLAINNAILVPLRTAMNTETKAKTVIDTEAATIAPDAAIEGTKPAIAKEQADWLYYNENHEKIGPVTRSELKQLARQGTIKPETVVEKKGLTGLAKNVRDKYGNGLPFPETTQPISSTPPTIQTIPVLPVVPLSDISPLMDKHVSNTSMLALLKKAESGDTEAMRELAMMYVKGDGVDPDVEEAERWIEKAAKLGDAEAQSEIADVLRIDNRDVNKAFYWEQKAAEQGLPHAQYNLAVCFRDGIGTSANPEKALHWYRKAAENGNTESKKSLAICYLRGDGTPQDLAQAIYWLQQASDEGNAEAKMRLGAAYIKGMGCAVDSRRGLALLHEAASLGNEKAKELLISDEVLDITTRENATPEQLRTFQARDEVRRLAAAKARLKRESIIMAIGGVIGAILGTPDGGFGGFLIGTYIGIGFGAWFGVLKTVCSRIYRGFSWKSVLVILGGNPGGGCIVFMLLILWWIIPPMLFVLLLLLLLGCPIVAIYRCVQHYQYIKLCEQSENR